MGAPPHIRRRKVELTFSLYDFDEEVEIIAIDEHGQPSFQALHHRAAHTIVYYAFDLLRLNGRDLTRLPLEERRIALEDVVTGTRVMRSAPLPGTPARIEAAVRKLKLEGIVAKRRNSPYEPGKRSKAWVKVKFNRRQEFVVGGYKPNTMNFESLLVGTTKAPSCTLPERFAPA
jgi:ATP-dependent DNA ligase